MTEIEKIKSYIERTAKTYKDISSCEMNIGEVVSLAHMDGTVSAIVLAFEYGRAKGYQAAKAKSGKAVQG